MRCACGCEWFVVERVIRVLGAPDPARKPIERGAIYRLRCVDCGGFDGARGPKRPARRKRASTTTLPEGA